MDRRDPQRGPAAAAEAEEDDEEGRGTTGGYQSITRSIDRGKWSAKASTGRFLESVPGERPGAGAHDRGLRPGPRAGTGPELADEPRAEDDKENMCDTGVSCAGTITQEKRMSTGSGRELPRRGPPRRSAWPYDSRPRLEQGERGRSGPASRPRAPRRMPHVPTRPVALALVPVLPVSVPARTSRRSKRRRNIPLRWKSLRLLCSIRRGALGTGTVRGREGEEEEEEDANRETTGAQSGLGARDSDSGASFIAGRLACLFVRLIDRFIAGWD